MLQMEGAQANFRGRGRGRGMGGADQGCFICGKTGHWRNECPVRKPEATKQHNQGDRGTEGSGLREPPGTGESNLSMLCNEEMAMPNFPNSANNTCSLDTTTTVGTYEKYDSPNYKKLPVVTLLVDNMPVEFLVDSGVVNSVIRSCEFKTLPKMSDQTLLSIAASGVSVLQRFSTPLRCKIKELEMEFEFSFLIC